MKNVIHDFIMHETFRTGALVLGIISFTLVFVVCTTSQFYGQVQIRGGPFSNFHKDLHRRKSARYKLLASAFQFQASNLSYCISLITLVASLWGNAFIDSGRGDKLLCYVQLTCDIFQNCIELWDEIVVKTL